MPEAATTAVNFDNDTFSVRIRITSMESFTQLKGCETASSDPTERTSLPQISSDNNRS